MDLMALELKLLLRYLLLRRLPRLVRRHLRGRGRLGRLGDLRRRRRSLGHRIGLHTAALRSLCSDMVRRVTGAGSVRATRVQHAQDSMSRATIMSTGKPQRA
jgi:hypothetical protein